MCTVSFLPLRDGGYLLATNRDESHRRGPAEPSRVRDVGGRTVLAPMDSDAGGTWVATDAAGRTLCILNGDRAPAAPPAPDAPSRGLLVLDLLTDPRADVVHRRLEEKRRSGALREKPFKLLIVEPGDGGTGAHLTRLDWDGASLSVTDTRDSGIAVSSTFETDAVTDVRTSLFETLREAVTEHAGDPVGLQRHQHRWHAGHAPSAPEGDAFGVCMHRDDARTVSCTLVAVTRDQVAMSYQPGHPCGGAPTTDVAVVRSKGKVKG